MEERRHEAKDGRRDERGSQGSEKVQVRRRKPGKGGKEEEEREGNK